MGEITCRCSPELCQHSPNHAPVTAEILMTPGPDGRRLQREFNAAVGLADDIRYTALIVILSRQLRRHPTDHEIVGFLEGDEEERAAIWMDHGGDDLSKSVSSHPSNHRNRRHLQTVIDPKE